MRLYAAVPLPLALTLAVSAASPPPPTKAGLAIGIAPSGAPGAVFAPFDAALGAAPQRLQLAGTRLCVGWTKGDCDGLCLETAACDASAPRWTVDRSGDGNVTHLRTPAGRAGWRGATPGSTCDSGCCMDFEDKVNALQAFPVCLDPLGNQAFTLEPVSGGISNRARFGSGGRVAMLGKPVPPPPAPAQSRPINATLSGFWRPTFHPTGFGALASEAIGHLQDPSAPFQDAAGLWHVFPDCTPETWNAAVQSP